MYSLGLIGQTDARGRHRNGRRRANLAANRVDTSSSDEFDASNGQRRFATLRRRNSRDFLNSDVSKATTTVTTEAICHESNGHSKSRWVNTIPFVNVIKLFETI